MKLKLHIQQHSVFEMASCTNYEGNIQKIRHIASLNQEAISADKYVVGLSCLKVNSLYNIHDSKDNRDYAYVRYIGTGASPKGQCYALLTFAPLLDPSQTFTIDVDTDNRQYGFMYLRE